SSAMVRGDRADADRVGRFSSILQDALAVAVRLDLAPDTGRRIESPAIALVDVVVGAALGWRRVHALERRLAQLGLRRAHRRSPRGGRFGRIEWRTPVWLPRPRIVSEADVVRVVPVVGRHPRDVRRDGLRDLAMSHLARAARIHGGPSGATIAATAAAG